MDIKKHDLCGGIFGVNGAGIPLRGGFRFDGWDEDRAKWLSVDLPIKNAIDTKHAGIDDGLLPKEDGCPITTEFAVGKRGEAVYTVKTVYTDIKIDAVKDPAYDYGLHLRGAIASDPEYYKNRSTCIEVYMILSQDGRVYVYGEITDPDIVVKDEIISWKPHYCDGLHVYVEYGNHGQTFYSLGLITADESGKYIHRAPRGCVVKMSDKGYNFEFSFNMQGQPFMSGDTISFTFYYNDTNDYVDSKNYHRAYLKLPSRLNPEGDKFIPPAFDINDAVIFSSESATGAFTPESICDNNKTGDMIADILSGSASAAIVYPDLCPAHTVILAKDLFRRLSSLGAYVSVGAESEKLTADYLFNFDRVLTPESMALTDSVKYNGYALSIGNNGIMLAGRREDAINKAYGLLLSAIDYVKNGGKTSDLDSLYKGAFEEIANAPEMDGLTTVTDAGDGAYLLLKQNAEPADFDGYAQKLIASGYKLYTENVMTSVRCATYVNDTTVINLTYGAAEGDRSLRAVVDVKAMTFLPELKKESYTPVCKSSITQLAPTSVKFMTYVIKQDNGEYFIIDAGGNGAQKYIFDSLMKMSGGEDVVVSCWLFTHFHCDHIGGFIELADNDEYMKKITVKSIILNFPQWQVLDTSSAYDHKNLERWPGVVKKSGAKVYQARTGQKYYFGNVELEMLFTYEDLMPFNVFVDRTNPTSHIFSMTVGGQRFIMTGDACGEATKLLAIRYGSDLKADFVQLPHHGYGDGGTCPDFYKLVDAPWVLYPGTAYTPSKVEKWVCDNCKAYFLNIERDTVIPIPYNGEEV